VNRTVLVIGIGAGDPDHVTVQAIKAINRADVFLVVEKGPDTDELVVLRHLILDRHLEEGRAPRIVALPDPPRDRRSQAYAAAVEDWRAERSRRWGAAIAREVAEGEVGAFLVWGDPAVYDSTLAVLDHILARGEVSFAHEVIPGISSPQALAARHRVPFNRVAGAVQITTGRRLAQGFPADADDVLVMLDATCAFQRFANTDMDIYWGAYVGTADEILVAGPVADVGDEIVRRRAEARERKGWIMDTYLLRRSPPR
jgi:precorrin-6A synthase